MAFTPTVCAENYVNGDFTVVTNLGPDFAKIVTQNAKSFCEKSGQYKLSGPITIYFSRTQQETENLLEQVGYKGNSEYGYFVPENSTIYAHLSDNEGSGWSPLFHQLAVKIIEENFADCPQWFSEGLASFLGEQRILLNGQLTAPKLSPCRQKVLKDKIEKGTKPNIKRLFVLSKEERFNNWDIGTPYAAAFFYWLNDCGSLEKYLHAVKDKGYKIEVLETSLQKQSEKINMELSKYIKKNCYAAAYIKEGLDANDTDSKEKAFAKSLELKPGCTAALLELARLKYQQKNYDNCREYLNQIINTPTSLEYGQAQELMGDIFYYGKDYASALTHFTAAWKAGEFFEYKYRIAYKIANCYNNNSEQAIAAVWYKTFLENDWEPENTKTQTIYAKKFTGVDKMTDPNAASAKKDANSVPKVKLETSMGDIVIELDQNKAPVTVKNFLRYTNEKFFDGTIFHRVIPDFMIQGGGFTEDMQQKGVHEPIANESANGLRNSRGTIAMARTNDPDSATGQFFINLKDNNFLNGGQNKPGYAVFGKVVKGMEVVDAIAAKPTSTKGFFENVPVTPIVIKSATVVTE